ncbi:TorF family putative porin [Kaistia adipata]|uniref:TorF family putative porin n=1 Tax=Kaistia adipata TaxID=166954 RepID=UPI00146CEDC2|nr:TorF family putative porin [Kaistia adipata]
MESAVEMIPAEPQATSSGSGDLEFDISIGVTATTNYVSRGITNSGNDPAIQGYIEPSLGPLYVNFWSSNVDFGEGFSGAEIDAAFGVRPEFGPLKLDLGYVHYFYAPESVSPDYGELYIKADYEVEKLFTVAGRVFFAPDFNQSGDTATFVAGGVKVPLPHDFSLYGGVGYQFFEDPNAFEQLTWTAGLSYSWKSLTFDARYWDTDLNDDECVVRSGFEDGCGSRIVLSVSFDTSLSALKNLGK